MLGEQLCTKQEHRNPEDQYGIINIVITKCHLKIIQPPFGAIFRTKKVHKCRVALKLQWRLNYSKYGIASPY